MLTPSAGADRGGASRRSAVCGARIARHDRRDDARVDARDMRRNGRCWSRPPTMRCSTPRPSTNSARAQGADVAIGVVERRNLMRRLPRPKRTWLRFRGGAYTGANLFALRSPQVAPAIELWRSVEQDRKKAWRVMSMLGPLVLLGARCGCSASTRCSRQIGRQAWARAQGGAAVATRWPASMSTSPRTTCSSKRYWRAGHERSRDLRHGPDRHASARPTRRSCCIARSTARRGGCCSCRSWRCRCSLMRRG